MVAEGTHGDKHLCPCTVAPWYSSGVKYIPREGNRLPTSFKHQRKMTSKEQSRKQGFLNRDPLIQCLAFFTSRRTTSD